MSTQAAIPAQYIGWSDIALFATFENGHIAADEIYFLCVQFRKNFQFKKPLKIYVFSKICYYLPFTSMKNRKKNFMGKFLFDLVEENHFVKVVFLTLSFKKI